jgi:hypothetical protein
MKGWLDRRDVTRRSVLAGADSVSGDRVVAWSKVTQ